MSSILSNYEYDIFISYRHNDNRSGWVTDFVNALQEELAATIKEPLNIYFDKNPHDGLLETHHVDKSLEGKLKCLIFIPIVSQTYCDPKSFAWQHEFVAFNKLAQQDSLGKDIKLGNGNVASRILPVKIHNLDAEDTTTIENEIGGVLRAIEFIYEEAGVNRPLKKDDNETKNINGTTYRNQVNKVANAIKELFSAIKQPSDHKQNIVHEQQVSKQPKSKMKYMLIGIFLAALVILSYFLIPKYTSSGVSKGIAKSLAVLPFKSLSNGLDDDLFADGLTEELINSLSSIPNLLVTGRVSSFYYKDHKAPLEEIASTLGVNHLVEGSVRRIDDNLRITVQIVRAEDGINLWSEAYDEPLTNILSIQTSIAQNISKALDIVLDDVKSSQMHNLGVSNVDAFIAFQKGYLLFRKAHGSTNRNEILLEANHYFDETIKIASTFSQAYQLRADYFGHELLETINPDISLTENEIEFFFEKYKDNIENAINYSRDRGSTLLYKSDLVVFSNDWSSLKELISQLVQSTTCDRPNWIQNLLYIQSQSDPAVVEYFLKRINCDPLREENYQMTALAYLNAGNYDEGLKIIEDGLKMPFVQSNNFILYYIKGLLLNAKGMHEEAGQLQALSTNEKEKIFESIRYSALKGDSIEALNKWNTSTQTINWEESDKIKFNAIIGNRVEANRMAAQIDKRPYGSLYLSTIARYCLCGAPFDIEQTPNFKLRIEESGITWPPASPLDYPLKKW